MKKMVLIADDEPKLRLLVSVTISSDDYEVVEATDGDEAWRLIRQHRPAVALVDVQMPGRTGLELARAIKADPELAAMRVIMLSAKAHASDIQAGLEAGADRYLTKPFSPLALMKAIENGLVVA